MNWIVRKRFKKGEGHIYPFMQTKIKLPGVTEYAQLAPNGKGIDICITGDGCYQLTYAEIVNDFIKQHEFLKKQKPVRRK